MALLLVAVFSATAQRVSITRLHQRNRTISQSDTIAISPDTTSIRYKYIESLKAIQIHRDSTRSQRLLGEILQQDSTYAPAHYTLSTQLTRNQMQQVLEHSRKAYMLDTTNRWYARHYAHALLATGGISEATKIYSMLVEAEPNNIENLYYLAIMLREEKRFDEAIAVLDKAELRFGRVEALNALKLYMLYQTGQMIRAEQEARLSYEENPMDEERLSRLADIYLINKKDSLVEQLYIDAIRRDSSSVKNQLRLGQYYISQNRTKEYLGVLNLMVANPAWEFHPKLMALEELTADRDLYVAHVFDIARLINTLYQQYPNEPQAIDMLGSHYIFMGEIESCLELFKSHLEDEPPHESYYLAIIDIHEYRGEKDSVAHYNDLALKKFPSSPTMLLRKGFLQYEQGDLMGSIATMRRAEERTTGDTLRSDVLGYIGDMYHAIVERREALDEAGLKRDTSRYPVKMSTKKAMKLCYEYYDRALEAHYDNAAVLNNYAYFLSLEGRDLERAEQMSARAIELQRNASNLDTYAWILHLQGKHTEAQQYMRQALSLDSDQSAELQLHYGDILYSLESYAMAKIYWQRALQYGADKADIEFRLSLLEREQKPRLRYAQEAEKK